MIKLPTNHFVKPIWKTHLPPYISINPPPLILPSMVFDPFSIKQHKAAEAEGHQPGPGGCLGHERDLHDIHHALSCSRKSNDSHGVGYSNNTRP
jgi:hypothetical protein